MTPDPEVPEKKPRRKFTAQYKLAILEKADKSTQLDQLCVLLRKEGLDSSNLTTWRKQRHKGLLRAMSPKKPGWKKVEKNLLVQGVAEYLKAQSRSKHLLRDEGTKYVKQLQDMADRDKIPTYLAADRMAEERIKQIAEVKKYVNDLRP